MIVRCSRCGEPSHIGLRPEARCVFCGAPVGRELRRCVVAFQASTDARCPPGGCRLHELLFGSGGDPADPCPVELLMSRDVPAVAASFAGLHEEMEHAPPYPHPARAERRRRSRHADVLARWGRKPFPRR